MITLQDACQKACAEIGVVYRDFPVDGRWHSADVEGKRSGNGDGRIKLFLDGEGGIVYNWTKNGEQLAFFADDGRVLSPAEREVQARKREELKRKADQELAEERKVAAQKAVMVWKCASPAEQDHPYLSRKQIVPVETLRELTIAKVKEILNYHPRSKNELLTGRILIAPVKIGDAVSTCELIDEGGRKHDIFNGAKAGGYWAAQALPQDGVGDGLTICIGEGVATVLSGRQATGHIVVASLCGGNLRAVAEKMRRRYPNARIIILSDIGNAQKDAEMAARAIDGLLAIPAFQNASAGGTDFNDLHRAEGLDRVREIIESAAKPYREENDGTLSRIRVIDAFSFLEMTFPTRENILSPWLPRQGLVMVYALRGIGKTHFSLGIAYAAASAGTFLNWTASSPRGVLFIDGEMPASVLKERLARIAASSEKELAAPFHIITPDLQPSGMIDLTRPEDQRALEPYLKGVELIVVDNLSTLCRTGKENEGEAWLPVQEWALMQRAAGRSVLFIHHAGKGGEQRGTSRREDVLDTVIALKRPGDYIPEQGAYFEVYFEKARGIYGDDTKPFEARLVTSPDGKQEWTIRTLEQSTAQKVAKLLNEGIQQNEIRGEYSDEKHEVTVETHEQRLRRLMENQPIRRDEA